MFDDDGLLSGLTIDDLDIPDDDDLALPYTTANRWAAKAWWSTSEQEAHHLDYPIFSTLADRAQHVVRMMCRAVTDDPDAKLFDYRGEKASAADLLAIFDFKPVM